jgi:hypothetical protein
MKCPQCGCEQFYAKDPDDEYETHAFECPGDEVLLNPDSADAVEITPQTEAFCDRCAWHGKVEELKKE